MKPKINIPKFKNEDEERDFWSKTDLTPHVNKTDFKSVSFPHLKPTTRSISIRIPEYLIIRIKEKANELDIPYQTLMKQYLAQGALQ